MIRSKFAQINKQEIESAEVVDLVENYHNDHSYTHILFMELPEYLNQIEHLEDCKYQFEIDVDKFAEWTEENRFLEVSSVSNNGMIILYESSVTFDQFMENNPAFMFNNIKQFILDTIYFNS